MTLVTEKVVFRVDKVTGSVFALFPEIPACHLGKRCRSTRGPVEPKEAIRSSREAKPDEYQSLAEKLVKEGFKLKIVKRVTTAMDKLRKETAYIEPFDQQN